MFIKIFTNKKSSNNLFNNPDKYNDYRLDNSSENEILNNLKKKIYEADSMNKLSKSTEDDQNTSQISKIKLSLQNNNNNNLKRFSRKSIVNFNIKNKLNLIKDQINHSKSITANKLEKKFTYKLKGNNLVKKKYSKLSSDDVNSKKSNNIQKTKTMAKMNIKNILTHNSKNKIITFEENSLSDRILMKKRQKGLMAKFEKKNKENASARKKSSKKIYKTLIIDKKNNIHNIENKIFNQEGLFDTNIKRTKSKKKTTKSVVDSVHNSKEKKLILPKTLFPNDELTMKDLNKLVHKKEIELKNIHMTIREDLFGEKTKKQLQLTQSDEQTNLVKNATKFGFFGLIKDKDQFRMLFKRPPVYDSLLSNEEEYNNQYDHGIIYIRPNSLFKKIFDICLIFLFLYDVFINSWLNAYNNGELNYKYDFEIILNFIIEIFYIIDFLTGFFIAYYNNDEVLITKLDLIIINYLETWCFLDFIMCIPFDSILYFHSKNKIHKYSVSLNNEGNIYYILTFIRKLKFIKLLSMDGNNYFLSYLNEFEFFIFYGNIYLYILIFIMLLHNISCIYIIIGKYTFPNWIIQLGLNNDEFVKIYICSLYYIISTVTTVGYGDISTYTCNERLFGIILLIVGIMGYSLTLTNVSSYINKMNSKTEEFENKMKILKDIKENNSLLTLELYEKIRRHIKYQNSEKVDTRLILDDLPLTLRNNLLLTMYDPVIKNFVFFKNLHYTDFIIQILLKFKPIIAGYGDILFKDGEFIEEVIFIKNGRVSLNVPINLYENYNFKTKDETNELGEFKNIQKFNIKKILKKKMSIKYNENSQNKNDKKNKENKENKEEKKYLQILVLRENEHYGIIHIFLNKRSTLCAKIKSKKAELFYLNKNDCLEISQTYTQIWKKINKKSIVNYFQIENLVQKTLQVYYLSKGIKFSGIFNNETEKLDEINETSNESENSSESFFSNNTIESKSEEEDIESQHSEAEKNSNENNDKNNFSIKISRIPRPKKRFKNKNFLSYIEKPITKKFKKKSIEKKILEEMDSSDSSGMGNYQHNLDNYFRKISNASMNVKSNLSEIPTSLKIIKKNIFPEEEFNNLNSLQNNNTNNTNNLTPFSPTDINDEIYPNEQFIFKEQSTHNLNSQNTESNSRCLLNNNIIYNSNLSKSNVSKNSNDSKNNNVCKNNNENLIINNVCSFTYQNSYNNINELTHFKYISNKIIQFKLEDYIINSLFGTNKNNDTNSIKTAKGKRLISEFDYNDDNSVKNIKLYNNHTHSQEKNFKFNILKQSPKKYSDFKGNRKVDFKKFSKEEEINEKYYNNINLIDTNKTFKVNNFHNKKSRNYKHHPSFGIEKVGKHQLLDIVNNNMQQNIYMNGGGIVSGNNFVEDFLQNELKRNKTQNLKDNNVDK